MVKEIKKPCQERYYTWKSDISRSWFFLLKNILDNEKEKMKDILLFGIQGSGKGTQARKILTKYPQNFSYFEPGNILRAIKSNDNAI